MSVHFIVLIIVISAELRKLNIQKVSQLTHRKTSIKQLDILVSAAFCLPDSALVTLYLILKLNHSYVFSVIICLRKIIDWMI